MLSHNIKLKLHSAICVSGRKSPNDKNILFSLQSCPIY